MTVNSATKELISILGNEKNRIQNSISSEGYGLLLFESIRVLDLFDLRYSHDSENYELKKMKELFHMGWSSLFSLFYSDAIFNEKLPIMPSPSEVQEWANSYLQVLGRLELCKQFISYEEAGLGHFRKKSNTEFDFSYTNPKDIGIEYFEKISHEFLRSVKGEMIQTELTNHMSGYENVKRQLRSSLKPTVGNWMINYTPTDEIDQFYSRLAHFILAKEHDYDDFGREDMFGGIPYGTYIQFIQEQLAIVIKHIDYCFAQVNKTPQINLYHILSFVQSKAHYVDTYSDYVSMEPETTELLLSSVTLAIENKESHLDGVAPPFAPFIKLSDDQIIRSTAGFKNKPCLFLKRELKRRFPKDYFEAINRREDRFRNELYSIFNHKYPNRFVFVNRSVNIKSSNFQTDIDAVIYDKHTKSLGLFQLKWQDSFGNSMKERRSRISNLVPKSEEWIHKMYKWFGQNSENSILSSLGLDDGVSAISDTFIFVIARNHMHFTGVELNERAAWSSWPQFVEMFNTAVSTFDDPIKKMYVSVKASLPSIRKNVEAQKLILPDYELRFAKYKIRIVT